jgi:large subunit ribosomal protein L22
MRPPYKRRNHAENSPEFKASHRFAKIAARKVRRVLDRIRNLPVSEALDQLKFMEQRGAALVDKVLKSAIANADRAISDENVRTRDGDVLDPQPRLDVDDLYVHDAFAGDGPKIPRWKPRARGAAYPYKKFYSHIEVRLRPRPVVGPTPKKGTAAPAGAKKES